MLKVLGCGGMGVVFQAEDPQLGRQVALKAMLPVLASSETSRRRFLREARMVAAIEHDHIIPVYQVGEDHGVPFLAMPLLQGETLGERLRREGKLPLAEVLRIGREVAEGLAAAHGRGLMHRDIKPANIWLEAGSGRVKILDFGLARTAGGRSSLTQQGAIVGTPAYMSPEQVDGRQADARCDLFSLGCVLYAMATGVQPFQRPDLTATLLAVAGHQPPPPSVLEPELPESFSNLVLQLLAKAPGDRPASAPAVVEALRAIENEPPKPPPLVRTQPPGSEGGSSGEGPPTLPYVRRRASRLFRPRRLALLAVPVLLVLGLAWWPGAWTPLRSPRPVYLTLLGSGYEENLAVPHNVYGLNSLNALNDFAAKNFDYIHVAPRVDPASWKETFQDFRDNSAKSKTFILYLALHGGADDKGPYLILDSPNPGATSDSLVPLADLLKELEGLPRDTKKLLILDATQVRAVPRLMLANDFSRRLAEMNDAIKAVPNLVVLCSTRAYQRSWYDEERKQTAFGHYLLEGLKGLADRDPEAGNNDGRVNALELYQYVEKKVERWTWDNRHAVQQPLLLPLDEEGTQRARGMELVVDQEGYKGEKALPEAPALPTEDLRAAWTEAKRLLSEVPSAAVYSPHLLRRYLDLLVRAEQLFRAGAGGKAEGLLQTCTRLAKQIRAEKTVADRQSVTCALPMPAVLGLPRLPTAGVGPLEERFDPLWRAPTARDRKVIWAVLVGRDKDKSRRMLARLSAWMAYKVSSEPENLEKNLATVRKVLDDLSIDMDDRPTEIHHLAMWNYDFENFCLDPSGTGKKTIYPPPALLQLAVRTPLRAERAALGFYAGPDKEDGYHPAEDYHPFSEFVLPWTARRVETADGQRRHAQDLLFSSRRGDWGKAAELFGKARTEYEEAQKVAARVREGFALRDDVLARLPYYSLWLTAAGRYRDEPGDEKKWREDLDRLEKLWGAAHALNKDLESTPLAIRGDDDLLARVGEETQALAKQFRDVRQQFTDEVGQLPEADKALNKDWLAYEEALAVPFLGVDDRLKLLENFRRLSRDLNEKTGQKAEEVKKGQDPDKAARRFAYVQGRVQLAMLGRATFEADRQQNLKTWDQVQADLTALLTSDWWGWMEWLAGTSNQIAEHWRQLPGNIDRQTQEGRQQADPEKAARALTLAERWCRQIDGAGAALVNEEPYSPVQENRRLHLYELFVHQAHRTIADKWFGPNRYPYFKQIALKYNQDAKIMAGTGPGKDQDRFAKTREIQDELDPRRMPALVFEWADRPDAFQPGPSAVHITSEQEFELLYRVRPKGISSGYAVVRVEPGRGVVSADPEGFATWKKPQSESLKNPAKVEPLVLNRLKNPYRDKLFDWNARPTTDTQGSKRPCLVKGLYRGYEFDLPTDVVFHERANVIAYQYPLPNRAALAVYASDEMHKQYNPQRGAVAILVDFSGSMAWDATWKGDLDTEKAQEEARKSGEKNHTRRLDYALKALDKLLASLPKGTEVSLWAFQGPSRFGGEDVVSDLVKGTGNWQPEVHLGEFKEALRTHTPRGGTPLIKAMRKARDFLAQSKRKRKTMVVLTDGVPDDTTLANLRRDIEAIFNGTKNQKPPGIFLSVVGFRIDQLTEEEKSIFREFKKAVEEDLILPGMFQVVNDVDKLGVVLTRALNWQYELGLPESRIRRPTEEKLNRIGYVNTDDRLRWWLKLNPVPPRTYDFWEYKLFPDKRPTVELEPGEIKLYELTEQRLQRGSFLRFLPKPQGKPWPESLQWRMGAPDNHLERAGDHDVQDVLVLVENTSLTAQESLPALTWLEMQTPDGKPVLGVRWGNRLGYPASAWGMEVSEPRTEGRVQAWVRSTSSVRQPVLRDDRPLTEFFQDRLKKNNVITVQGVQVQIESVKVESFPWVTPLGLPVTPLGQQKTGEANSASWCVVVRLSYPKGHPVFVQPEPPVNPEEGGGYEHHFYTIAGSDRDKYTGIFWYGRPGGKPWDQKKIENEVKGLAIYSVDALKKDPETAQGLVFPLQAPVRVPTTPRFLQLLSLP